VSCSSWGEAQREPCHNQSLQRRTQGPPRVAGPIFPLRGSYIMPDSNESSFKFRAGLVASLFHSEITEAMIQASEKLLRASGGLVVDVIRVPGAYEFPLAAQCLIEDERVDLLVVLGYIEKGETLHGEVMGHVVQRALIELQLKYRKPIGLGIIGPGATAEQAESRKIGYAEDASRAALSMLTLLSGRATRGQEFYRAATPVKA
jgi:6,7-dimethyl-8-ribityllumazine synthase